MRTALQDDVRHCEALVREADRDRFLAALFAPAARRGAVCALDAFAVEIARIGARVRDPLAGEIRLQWWRDVLDGERGEEAAANPVAAALLATLEQCRLPREPLVDLLDARGEALYGEPPATRADLAAFARRTAGAVLGLGWRAIAGGGEMAPDDAPDHAGVALTIRDLLVNLPAEVARRRCPLPLDLLQATGVTPAEVTAGKTSPGLLAALGVLRREARRAAEELLAALRAHPSDAHAVFLPALLVPMYLDTMERAGYDPFRTAIEVPQWQRQWRMWRLARRIAP